MTMQPDSDTKFDGYTPKVAFFFPGQGAQTVGMAKDVVNDVPKAKELSVFSEQKFYSF